MTTSPLGSHALPARLSSTPPPPRRRLGRRIGLTTGGILLLVAGGAAVQFAAHTGYDDARESYETAASSAASAESDLDAQVAEAGGIRTLAAALTADASGLVPAEVQASLGSAAGDLDVSLAEAADVRDAAGAPLPPEPFWAWEAFGAADLLRQDTTLTDAHADDLRNWTSTIEEGTDALSSHARGALTASADVARGAEAENASARNEDVIALRHAVSDLDAIVADDASEPTEAAYAFQTLATEVQDVRASAAAELAEKAGPLQDARLEVEAFARSLAPGLLIDFDWAVLVNGLGVDGWLSGLTWWWYADGGYATIELSDSVAEGWPSAASQALVAHEVGHAITVRCSDMYDADDPAMTEAWATAWAISMGFTDAANGTSAYGPPPPEMITAASACR